jgi:predicted nucleic acid-binding protein
VIFLDSNILVYASGLNGLDDPRTAKAREIVAADEPYAVSVQVIQEFWDRVTHGRGQGAGLPRDDALAFVAQWRTFRVEPLTLDLFERATQIEARFGYRYWDCAIVAAALTSGCHSLLSEDLQHGQMIDGLRIANPFLGLA